MTEVVGQENKEQIITAEEAMELISSGKLLSKIELAGAVVHKIMLGSGSLAIIVVSDVVDRAAVFFC